MSGDTLTPTDMRPRFDPADWATCDVHERVHLIGEPCPVCAPSLTTEQARVLAARWADALNGSERERAANIAAWLTLDEDREQLFAWVRARMAEALGTGKVTRERRLIVVDGIGKMLGWGNDGRDPVTGTGDAPDEMEAWFADAWALCEAVGWPS